MRDDPEAWLWVMLARLGLRLFGFKRLVRTLGSSGPVRRVPAPALVDRVAAAIDRRAGPMRQGCLPRAFAAAWMLRARGYRPTLHYGVRPGEGTTRAHAWLDVAGLPVVGQDEAEGYMLLASFPRDGARH